MQFTFTKPQSYLKWCNNNGNGMKCTLAIFNLIIAYYYYYCYIVIIKGCLQNVKEMLIIKAKYLKYTNRA